MKPHTRNIKAFMADVVRATAMGKFILSFSDGKTHALVEIYHWQWADMCRVARVKHAESKANLLASIARTERIMNGANE